MTNGAAQWLNVLLPAGEFDEVRDTYDPTACVRENVPFSAKKVYIGTSSKREFNSIKLSQFRLGFPSRAQPSDQDPLGPLDREARDSHEDLGACAWARVCLLTSTL